MTGDGADRTAEGISLAAAMDGAMDIVFLVEHDGSITYANPVVEPILGWEPASLIGTNLTSLIHPDDLEPILAAVARADAEASHSRSTTHIRLQQRDGAYGHFSLGGNLVAGIDEPYSFVTVFRRADDLESVFDLLTRLTDSHDLGDVLRGLPEFIRWRHDAPHTTITWIDGTRTDGTRRQVAGDELPHELDGTVPGSDASSPWVRGWLGHETLGTLDDLPPDLRAVAESAGLASFWVRPVLGRDDQVEALLTMWDPPRDRPLSAYVLIFDYMTRAARVAVLWHGQRDELLHHAAHDSLTGVANRRIFYEAVAPPGDPTEHAITDAVAFIDLDGFKPVNDSHGHAAGDIVLAEVARRLVEAAAPTDLVTRLGGDEFAILRLDTTESDAQALGDRVVELIQKPIDLDAGTVVIGASVGLAVGPRGQRTSFPRRADEALYRAKAAGGRCVVLLPAFGGDAD